MNDNTTKPLVEKIAFVNEAEMLASIRQATQQAVTDVLVTTLTAIADTSETITRHRLNAAIAVLRGETVKAAIIRSKLAMLSESRQKREEQKENKTTPHESSHTRKNTKQK